MHIVFLLFFLIIASADFQIQVSAYESIGWIARGRNTQIPVEVEVCMLPSECTSILAIC